MALHTIILHAYIISPFAVVELGFQRGSYNISEETSLGNSFLCVVINAGILEREVVVSLFTTDGSTEGIIDFQPPFLKLLQNECVPVSNYTVLCII